MIFLLIALIFRVKLKQFQMIYKLLKNTTKRVIHPFLIFIYSNLFLENKHNKKEFTEQAGTTKRKMSDKHETTKKKESAEQDRITKKKVSDKHETTKKKESTEQKTTKKRKASELDPTKKKESTEQKPTKKRKASEPTKKKGSNDIENIINEEQVEEQKSNSSETIPKKSRPEIPHQELELLLEDENSHLSWVIKVSNPNEIFDKVAAKAKIAKPDLHVLVYSEKFKRYVLLENDSLDQLRDGSKITFRRK